MTGPIEVDGAIPGDELVVDIVAMELRRIGAGTPSRRTRASCPSFFPMPPHPRRHQSCARIAHLPWGLELNGGAVFRHHRRCAAAGDGPVTSNIPRAFGGNMDNKNLRPGAKLHLPVFNPGGLLSLGDGHALQGDGEVCLTASRRGSPAGSESPSKRAPASTGLGRKRRRTL